MTRTLNPNYRSRRVSSVVPNPASFEVAGNLSKLERNAHYLLPRLRENFSVKPIFTREDCLHVAFLEVATITRYPYIRETLRYLIDVTAEVVEISNTEMTLRGNHKRALRQQNLSYLDTVSRLIRRHFADRPFNLTDVLDVWTSDQLLTQNGKRVAIRGCLARLVREKQVVRRSDYSYEAISAQANGKGKVHG